MMKLNQVFIKSILDALKATSAPLDGVKVHLFQNQPNLSETTVAGDMTEADFTGYAASGAIAWSAAFNIAAGGMELRGPHTQFTCSAPGTSNTIYGYYVCTTAGVYLWGEYFDDPVPVIGANDSVFVEPRFAFPPN